MWIYQESSDRLTWTTLGSALSSAELASLISGRQLCGMGYWRALNEVTGLYV